MKQHGENSKGWATIIGRGKYLKGNNTFEQYVTVNRVQVLYTVLCCVPSKALHKYTIFKTLKELKSHQACIIHTG